MGCAYLLFDLQETKSRAKSAESIDLNDLFPDMENTRVTWKVPYFVSGGLGVKSLFEISPGPQSGKYFMRAKLR